MSIRKVIKFNNINKKIFRGGAVMKKNNILKFDNFFSKIAFIYIILIPFFFQERNRIIFICFGLFKGKKDNLFISCYALYYLLNIWNYSVIWFDLKEKLI